MRRMVPFIFLFVAASVNAGDMPGSFVEVREVIPDAVMDIRYFTEHNFGSSE